MASYSKELLKGAADTLVLSAFAEGEKYGYQVVKELERRSEGYFRLKEGTLYPILHRLENQGLLSARWTTMPNGSERRYYALTAKGQRMLSAKLDEWHNFSQAVARVTGAMALGLSEAP
ncbi:MAG TPA: helix-turn-helix transcriptional regulator [Chloroflexota bacterium]|nr:helix-turn-helix transcriptional regulator [Chloroflexota bacterium]